ncbi:hypothetical protein HYT52_04625 [Candidatus Woesearchaeota archaeon]|nr:hypothetical protein [Candidatus Woesearchaeota archaeon]
MVDLGLDIVTSVIEFIDIAMGAVTILLVWYGLKLVVRLISSFGGGGHGHH